MAHEVVQIILFIVGFTWLFETHLLDGRYALLLGSARHLLYFGFGYPLTLFGLYYLHLLAGSFCLLGGGFVFKVFVGSEVVEGQAECVVGGGVVGAESEQILGGVVHGNYIYHYILSIDSSLMPD